MAKNDPTKIFSITVKNEPNAKIEIDGNVVSAVEVEQGTTCHWRVSAPGYKIQIGECKVVSDINLNLTLLKVPAKPTPNNSYMKVLPKKGKYVIDFKEIFKDMVPPTEGHEDEYLWTHQGFVWWKKLNIPKASDFIVQETGDAVDVALSQKAITELLERKADKETVYTKEILDELLRGKANSSEILKTVKLENSACVIKNLNTLTLGDKVTFQNYEFVYGETAFDKIQDAISSDAQNILIAEGSYSENLIIEKDNLNIFGYGHVVVHGNLLIKSNLNLSISDIKFVFENEDDKLFKFEKEFSGFYLNNVDAIVKNGSKVISNEKEISDLKFERSRFSTDLQENGKSNVCFDLKNIDKFELSKSSVFGSLKFSQKVKNVLIKENNFIVKDDNLLTLSGEVVDDFTFVGNFSFGETVESIFNFEDINFENLNLFKIVGNQVCFNKAFVCLKRNVLNVKKEKMLLAFNTSNNASGSKLIVDEENEDPRFVIGEGNIATNDSAITIEQVENLINAETERAKEKEEALLNLITSHINNFNNPHKLSKEQLGLENVDNVADLDKPLSTATKEALDKKLDKEDLPSKLPNPTNLEILFNRKHVADYNGGEEGKVVADIHADMDTLPDVSWQVSTLGKTPEQIAGVQTLFLYEKGQKVSNQKLVWSPLDIPSLKIKEQYLDDIMLDRDVREYFLPEITSDEEKVLKIIYTDSSMFVKEISVVIKFKFINKMFFGTSNKEELLNEDILNFDSSLDESIDGEYSFKVENEEYLYLIIPEEKTERLKIKYGGLIFDDWNISNFVLKNKFDFENNYKIFRSYNKYSNSVLDMIVEEYL